VDELTGRNSIRKKNPPREEDIFIGTDYKCDFEENAALMRERGRGAAGRSGGLEGVCPPWVPFYGAKRVLSR